jgi:hypothetical protein
MFIKCVESDAFCWICHTEGDASDCCCELCPRLYHARCLSIEPPADAWVCPECEVCSQRFSFSEVAISVTVNGSVMLHMLVHALYAIPNKMSSTEIIANIEFYSTKF